MFTKILIANRGEIACRIIATAKRLGINTVAVYSDADQLARHVSLADEAIHIGASPSSESYLIGQKIIDAALKSGAQAIHPGYGFLSENASFAKACVDNSVVFIGPPTGAIEAMGSKSAAKEIMEQANVPLVPGYHGNNQDPTFLKAMADDMGYPVLLKAVAGGGGKGMRQVWSSDEFDQGLNDAKRESMSSFGNDEMLVEKYLTQPRHVEVQVFCDQHGNGVYLFERDCSVQRRHQKVIEEAPAPNISREQREAMGTTAVRAAQAINYEGAGTVEYLLDVDGSFYFMEMNTRLQVEHPVTEMITGQDLVEWQLKVAIGEDLPLQQDQLVLDGHAFEARVYAEDPSNDFLPTTGTLSTLRAPQESQHVRVDTGVVEGDEVSHYYDPMIAKLIVWDKDRQSALSRMSKALREYQISGVSTNLEFLNNLVDSEPFIKAELDTGFIEKHADLLFKETSFDLDTALCQSGLYLMLKNQTRGATDPWNINNAWRMNQANLHAYEIVIADKPYTVNIEQLNTHSDFVVHLAHRSLHASATLFDTQLHCTLDGHQQTVTINIESIDNESHYLIFHEKGSLGFQHVQVDCGQGDKSLVGNNFIAPMNGTVVEVLANSGEHVKQGQAIIIIEAMKMQHTMQAPGDGIIVELFYAKGDLVDGGSELINFVADEDKV